MQEMNFRDRVNQLLPKNPFWVKVQGLVWSPNGFWGEAPEGFGANALWGEAAAQFGAKPQGG